jgi:hypothetical protein
MEQRVDIKQQAHTPTRHSMGLAQGKLDEKQQSISEHMSWGEIGIEPRSFDRQDETDPGGQRV